MSIEDIIREKATEAGWDDDSTITVLCRYIANQKCDSAFEDFLDRAIEEEKELTVQYDIFPGRAVDVEFDDDGWIVVRHTEDMYDHVAFVQTETMARLYVHANGHHLPDDPQEDWVQRVKLPCSQHAAHATAALTAYNQRRGQSGETAGDELKELVTDILHLCAESDVPPARVLRHAIRAYERERGETIITAILTPEAT